MAWHGSIKLGESEGGRILVIYKGEARIYDLGKPENVDKLRRIGTMNHAGAMRFLSRFPRVPEAEKARIEALKVGKEQEFKAILDAVKAPAVPREVPPPAPDPKKKGKK